MKTKILTIITIIAVLLTTGCKKNNETKLENIKTNDKYSENIKVQVAKLNDTLLFTLKNNNKITIDTDIKINYYNKDNKLIDSDEDTYSAITPEKEVTVLFNVYKNYSYYEIELVSDKTNYSNYENDIKITEKNNADEKSITCNIKNTSKNTIEYIEVSILFYKNNKLISYDSEYIFKLPTNKETKIDFLYPYDDKFKLLSFDKYEIKINEACSYNKETKDED